MKTIYKIVIGLFLAAAVALPAGGVLALSYGRGMMGTTISTNNSDVFYQAQSVDSQKMQDFMFKLQNGNLSADEQKEMYGLMSLPTLMMGSVSAVPAIGGQQFGYRSMMSAPFFQGPGYNHQLLWYSLMCVITVILLWAVLLLSIVALSKWIKLKNHVK